MKSHGIRSWWRRCAYADFHAPSGHLSGPPQTALPTGSPTSPPADSLAMSSDRVQSVKDGLVASLKTGGPPPEGASESKPAPSDPGTASENKPFGKENWRLCDGLQPQWLLENTPGVWKPSPPGGGEAKGPGLTP